MARWHGTALVGFVAGLLSFGGFANESISFGLPIWLRDLTGVRTPVELIGERLFRILPAVWFGFFVTTFERVGRQLFGVDHFGKLVGFLSANVVIAIVGAGMALALRRALDGMGGVAAVLAGAAATWVAAAAVWTLLLGGGFLASTIDQPGVYLGMLAVYSLGFAVLVRLGERPRSAARALPDRKGAVRDA